MSARNIFKGCIFLFLSVSMLIVALVIITLMATILIDYNFAENPVTYSIIYWLLPILPVVTLCYLVFRLFKKSLGFFVSEESSSMENLSGKGKESVVPAEIKGWNWGAFVFNWVWGIGNNTYRALFAFIPIVNIFMMILLGLKGNEWAWKHKKWESVEHFKEVQRKWSKAALAFIGLLVILSVFMFFRIESSFLNSAPYKLSLVEVTESKSFITKIGQPYEVSIDSGSMGSSKTEGTASIKYTVEGPNGEGVVNFDAQMDMGTWTIVCLTVDYPESQSRDELVACQ
ncbi:cytochrome c oxidase assembly factor Coa1 family protein [uncultured Photobacterium sp.]|uniref:cytochrome c oxidase assembly factor Coa1 family protein n=1 Tax=uncultured Photobacterium sp. TaxID=173973 RepID=UPI002633B78C|nr:cytochrome c oxidase assembly factor Coa1 family protein [uncultured Photobacterium sp.]